MSNFVELKQGLEGKSEGLINLNRVSYITIDIDNYNYITGEYSDDPIYFIVFVMDDKDEHRRQCSSLLEAQMIYAKLRKYLCKNEELNEIL